MKGKYSMSSTNYTKIQNITPEFLSIIKLPNEKGKKINYLMVLPVMAPDHNCQYSFPIGFASVCSALKSSGRKVFTLNLNYKLDPVKLLRHSIITNNIDVVLTGGFGGSFWNLKMIIDEAKKIKTDIITVVGGGIITADPEVAMEALENADYVVIGEGEITVNSLAYALETKSDAADIDGVICFRNGEWLSRENFPYVLNLGVLPFPDFVGLEFGQMLEKPLLGVQNFFPRAKDIQKNYIAFMEISRSCPNRCTFCFHSSGEKFRQMSMDTIFKLLDWLIYLYPIDILWPTTEVSFADHRFAIEFSRRIQPYNVKWLMDTRPDMVSKKMLTAAKESGCVYIFIGIESADNIILKSMQKNITIEEVERACYLADKVGIMMEGNIMFGDLEETMETFYNSVKWGQAHRKWISSFRYIHIYPGTHLYKVACEKGIIKDRVQYLKDGFPLVNVSKLTDDEYNTLPVYISIFRLENKLEEAKIEPQSDFTVNVMGRCPHCAKEIHYYHFECVFNIAPQRCPICREHVIANPIEYCDSAKLNKNAEVLLKGPGAIWAVNTYNFYWLLKFMPVLRADNVKFINKDEIIIPENGRSVKTLDGKEIFTPDIIDHERIDTIIVPNRPKVFNEIKRQCAAKFPHVKQIVHITELL